MILISNLEATRVNLLQNDYAAGLPSPFAFLGLLAKVAGDVGLPRWSLGVLPILHRVEAFSGRTKGQIIPDAKSTFKVQEIPSDYRGRVVFSLLVDGPETHAQKIGTCIEKARLAGGAIFPSQYPKNDGARMVVDDGTVFHSVRRGRAVVPVAGYPMIKGGGDEFDAYFDTLKPDSEHAPTVDKIGWRVPLAVAYNLLEDPHTVRPRTGKRADGIPHVFAEPVGGIGHLISPRSPELTALSTDDLRALMWRYSTRNQRVAAHPHYL